MFLKRLCSSKSFLGVALMAAVIALPLCSKVAQAQTWTTGAISGVVTDPSGAVIPGATVRVTSIATGAVRIVTTGSDGAYLVDLLTPGPYKVHVAAKGFAAKDVGPISVQVNATAAVNVTLQVGVATQTVQVTAAPALVHTNNPNTTVTLSRQQLDSIPNPGMDLSYEMNFVPGANMSTGAGYGNVEVNGLPATSNNFTIDGLNANDPFLNLNNSGATNLQLGLGAMKEVSVSTLTYAADTGHLGAAQVNYVTNSGTNQFHGSLMEMWNGSKLNSTDYFVNADQFLPAASRPHKPFSNVNQFGADLGGPIKKNKIFFFTDLEGTRIVVPTVNTINVPSAAYQAYTLSQLPLGGCDYQDDPSDCAAGNQLFPNFPNTPPQPGEVPLYENMFKLYGNVAGQPTALLGCPLTSNGTVLPIPSLATPTASIPDGNGCDNRRVVSQPNHTGETLWTIRIDHNLNASNTLWYRFEMDNGTQATYTDPINPIFDAKSIQPERSASAGYTHIFSPTLVNEFNPGFSWYTAIFTENPKGIQAFPIDLGVLAGEFTPMGGGESFIFPQGRNVMLYQFNDNLTWTHGRSTFEFGGVFGRELISDHDYGFFKVPAFLQFSLPEFTYGVTGFTIQNFAHTYDEPFGALSTDLYAQDTIKATRKLTLVVGLRTSLTPDMLDQQPLISRPSVSFDQISHNVNIPPSQVVHDGLAAVAPSMQFIAWQPRASLAYLLTPKTVIRTGFGVFTDVFPGLVADSMSQNPPYYNSFNEGVFGLDNGAAIAPGVPGSAYDAAVADNHSLLTAWSSGALSCASPNATSPCVPPVALNTLPGHVKTPYSMQWSFGIQRQFGQNWALDVNYVGTAGREIPYSQDPNGYQLVCPGCFAPYPLAASAGGPGSIDPRFGAVTDSLIGGNSNYNGLQVTATKRFSHGLDFQANYTWSHCLDEISNGGFLPWGFTTLNIQSAIPGDLRRNYGPCDYDYRHSFNGFYTYQLPFHSSNRFLSQVISGWQVSGTVFLRSGGPFSMLSSGTGSLLTNTSGVVYANLVPGQPLYHSGAVAGVTQPGQVQFLNPNAFLSVVDPNTLTCIPPSANIASAMAAENNTPANCNFGNMQRNFLRGPGFHWSDFFLTKTFKLTEQVNFQVSGQFFNVFNHPNFSFPANGAGVPGETSTLTGFGAISSTVSPATGLLGSFLGGDSSVRMIAFEGKLVF